MEILMQKLGLVPPWLIENAPKVLVALLIFWIGRKIVRKLSGITEEKSRKVPTIDETLARFFGSVVLFFGMIAVVVSALTAMNVNLAFIGTIIAALVVALGFALQDTLGDVASGVMLAFFRPFGIGDEIEAGGEHGVVTDVGLFATTMTTRDNIQKVVGNGAAFGSTIKNYNAFGDRRLDMDFGVGYDADLDKAIKTILGAAKGDDRIRTEPAPWAKVTGLGDSAVTIQLRLWVDSNEHRNVQMDMPQRVKEALDKAGIDIPYEHCVVVRKAS